MTTNYVLGKTYQIIDLNNGLENFQLNFDVQRTSDENGEFYGVICEKGTPANELQFNPSQNGRLNGQMIWQQNQRKDFVLILYADDGSTMVDVTIDLQPLPPKENEEVAAENKRGGFLKYILIIALIGLGIYLAYRFFWVKKSSLKFTNSELIAAEPVEVAQPEPLPEVSQGLDTVLSTDLMDRVRKLPLK